MVGILTGVRKYKYKGKYYYNIPCAFDIETSSFYEDDDKRAIMYIWQFAIGQKCVVYGRTWTEFLDFTEMLIDILKLSEECFLTVYVHNLGYECQFIRKYFDIISVLATRTYKPINFKTSEGFFFRCSYLLTNSSLETLSKNYNLENGKLHDFNYDLIRNSQTVLTDEELSYCFNDVLAVTEYIEKIELPKYRLLPKIPNTSTGKVREFCRLWTIKQMKSGGLNRHNADYRRLISGLTLTVDEYNLQKSAYAGGLTHSNANFTGKVIENVTSMDFNSSYPASLCLFPLYPMSKGEHVEPTETEFYNYIENYACFFSITFINIESKVNFEHIISVSKCEFISSDFEGDNGRLIRANGISICLTDLDFKSIQKFYKFDRFIINNMYIYKRGYLPRELIKSILQLYNDKTKLKNVPGMEIEYLQAKERVNGVYGCCVCDIAREDISLAEEWESHPPDVAQKIEEYNKDKNRFLFYAWGVFCSAIARYNLINYGIYNLKNDYLYSDTDSVKFINYNKNKWIFDAYNRGIDARIKKTASDLGIDEDLFRPKDKFGNVKTLGIFDMDGQYSRFKTLGAKRYMYESHGEYFLTCAGLSKNNGMNYIKSLPKGCFDEFCDSLEVPPEYTGKQTHTYINDEIFGEITDYQGHTAPFHELSYIHLENCEFSLSITDEYINYIARVQEEETF